MDDAPGEDLELAIERVAAHPEPDGTVRLMIATTRGEIRGVLHPSAAGPGAVIYVGGASGGFQGPARDLYPRLAERLRPRLSGLRLHYRRPGSFDECVLDVLAGVSFLRGVGAAEVALVGHSFGGAVVIKAGELAPNVSGVAALAPQLHGARDVERLGKPLLLVHGMRDAILHYTSSEEIHRRAREPKEIVLYPEADHLLSGVEDELEELLSSWLASVAGGSPPLGRN
jgi:alpha-beta hydrolase superfamily lysophospholipase